MGEGRKRRSIDEMIEHMTADFQSSEGHYIQLGFSASPNSVSSQSWCESYVQNYNSTPQIHCYQPNNARPVFLHDGPMQFKSQHPTIPTSISPNVEVTPSFYNVHGSPPANPEGMTCENHVGGIPYVTPGQPPRTLGGFVPYQSVPDHFDGTPRNYNLFGEGQVRLIQVTDDTSKSNNWSPPASSVSELMAKETEVRIEDHVVPNQSKKTELIDNLVGQWVPAPSGNYNPFGNHNSPRNTESKLREDGSVILKKEKVEINGILTAEKPKCRINIEEKIARPSYSDVLSKTPPTKTHSSPTLANKSMTNPVGNASEGKVKGANGGITRNRSGGGRKGCLKRQYSSGSDEHVISLANVKLNQFQDNVPGVGDKFIIQGELGKSSGEALPRRWVSLDDLDCGDGEVEDCGRNETSRCQRNLKGEQIAEAQIRLNVSSDYERVKKGGRGLSRTKSGGSNQGCNDEAADPLSTSNSVASSIPTLNNYKASGGSGAGKNQGQSGTKRPLHINNNLGTAGIWGLSGHLSGEKNIFKGGNAGGVANVGTGISKNCKACSEERKATSASSSGSGSTKSSGGDSSRNFNSGGTSSRGRGGGCCSSGGGGQGAPQPPPPPPERTSREPLLGKRGQRNRRREGQAPLMNFCRTARQHVIQWGTIILQALLWFLHLLSDILSLSSHLLWNMGDNVWKWLSVTRIKIASAFHDRIAPWFSRGSKSSTSNRKSNGLGSVKSKWWISSWIERMWRSTARCCRKTGWRVKSWFGRRGLWWGGASGNTWDQEWESDDDDKDGAFSGRDKGTGRKFGRGEFGFHHPGSLETNISLPSTGEEAMKRLLACKGKDPYSILGVTPNCSDDDVKKYYKRQAFLVHPDKNGQPGAEEAFKILVHAFDLIGEPEKRQAYDLRVIETRQAENAWSEFSDLLSQLQEKMAEAANTIRCTKCCKRHRRISVPRPCYAARLCSECKIHHAAREGDIWAESSMMGFLWHYYACMEGAIYDITEWAACQGDNLRHLRPNSHNVQYRILLGKRGGNSGPAGSPSTSASHPSGNNPKSSRSPESPSDPDLDHFINTLYSGVGASGDNSQKQEQTRKRKGKRKK
ncbi:uncharacterized protein LOC124172161 [Ischnura elegans]|uniref:uncharacterized protein LOC124172161 n=1 Tax=Ischnura elegans TaxID=197161 RepID=UPI001ED8B8A1|nr:uncharacterized protein LOC124172161 [Ischnura elegans]